EASSTCAAIYLIRLRFRLQGRLRAPFCLWISARTAFAGEQHRTVSPCGTGYNGLIAALIRPRVLRKPLPLVGRVQMNRISRLLAPNNVLVNVSVTSKKRLFEQAGLLFENSHGIERSRVTDALLSRERLGSTGLGDGVAIPHGRIKGLQEALGAVIR